jgi:putative hemolysin
LNEILDAHHHPHEIWSVMKEKLKVQVRANLEGLDHVPPSGPVIFIANHPFGVVDGILFGEMISRVRPNFKFLVNEVLCREEQLNQFFLPIDFRDTKEAMQTNLETRRKSLEYLAEGNAIAIFPAGGVATSKRLWKEVTDLDWKRFVTKLIRKSNATVIPFFFHGKNSALFQTVSHISPSLRLALLLNEVRNKKGKEIHVRIGNPIHHEQIASIDKKDDLLQFLRRTVFSLENGLN